MQSDCKEKSHKLIETIIDIFVRVVGFIERDKVSKNTNPPKDFYIDTDDLSFYLEEVEKHFNVNIPQSEWFSIDGTIESVADLVLRHLSK